MPDNRAAGNRSRRRPRPVAGCLCPSLGDPRAGGRQLVESIDGLAGRPGNAPEQDQSCGRAGRGVERRPCVMASGMLTKTRPFPCDPRPEEWAGPAVFFARAEHVHGGRIAREVPVTLVHELEPIEPAGDRAPRLREIDVKRTVAERRLAALPRQANPLGQRIDGLVPVDRVMDQDEARRLAAKEIAIQLGPSRAASQPGLLEYMTIASADSNCFADGQPSAVSTATLGSVANRADHRASQRG